jgi:hypothetical protein
MVDTEQCWACNGTGHDPRYEGGCPSCGGVGKWSNHGPTCPKHGCVTCGDLEKQRPVPPDEYAGLAKDLAETDQLIFADLDEHPENVRFYTATTVAKWRAARGK